MNEDKLHAMRHSAAHVLATAITRKWPEVKLGIGPVVGESFYYDVDLGDAKISEDDFAELEKTMKAVIDENQAFEQNSKPIDEATKWAQGAKQTYKEELLNDLKRAGTTVAKDLDAAELGTIADGDAAADEVGFYTNGDFTDLCRGPHVESTGKIGAFKLTKVAGAFWRGKEDNPQMQRVYGVAFETQEELDKYLEMQEEAKRRDHRKLGQEMDLFVTSDLVGSGLPLFTPRGTILRDKLNQLSQQLRARNGYERVHIPHITKTDLYKTSGHWDKFGDELFLVESQESSSEFAMKPMNCPHHIQIFAAKPRSYRDMPVKYMETTIIYRDEKSGELHGIERVRAATQDDCHAFCTPEQVPDVVAELIEAAQELYKVLEMPIESINLSFKDDSDGYLGDKWDKAQEQIEQLAKDNELKYAIDPGEAAFYGPKIDFLASDAIGRKTQTVTVQLDFVQPDRFQLEYVGSDGETHQPIMIHSTLLGSLERFLSVYIEHTAGWFPFWVAPEQVRVVTVNDETEDYVGEITTILDDLVLMSPLKYNEIRYAVDSRKESLGKKIKEAQNLKIPVVLIVGPKDAEAKVVSVRTQDGEETVKLGELEGWIKNKK